MLGGGGQRRQGRKVGDGRRDGQPMLRELADEESRVWEADKGVGLGEVPGAQGLCVGPGVGRR